MERVFYDIHFEMCRLAVKNTSTRTRSIIEHLTLLISVSMFCVVLLSHRQFVYRGGAIKISSKSSCLQNIAGFQLDTDVTHVYVAHINHEETDSWVCHESKWENCFSSHSDFNNVNACDVTEKFQSSANFTFSRERGFLLLDSELCNKHGISTQHVMVSPNDHQCFGDDPIVLYLMHKMLGYDTIIMNWLLALAKGDGFLYIPKSDTILELSEYLNEYNFHMPHRYESYQDRWHHQYFIFKFGVLLSSLFLFFLTTTLVSFTLRETQNRMLHFTLQLQHHVRQRRPFARLIVAHIVENMVFVPIMIGMVFFLMDCFYTGDRLLAFMVISGVWVCETYSAVCLRSIQGMKFFPKAFFLYFTLFHIYCFSCPFGFLYVSLASTGFFLLHCMLFFWNRYELPAVVSGQITRESPRMFTPTSIAHSNLNPSPGRMNHQIGTRQSQSYPSMNSLGMISSTSPHDLVIRNAENDDDSYIEQMNRMQGMRQEGHHIDTGPGISSEVLNPSIYNSNQNITVTRSGLVVENNITI